MKHVEESGLVPAVPRGFLEGYFSIPVGPGVIER